VVEHDNINFLQGRTQYAEIYDKYIKLHKPSKVARIPPGLRVDDPLHYSTMTQRICNAYNERFG
jgi:hypothetical protein